MVGAFIMPNPSFPRKDVFRRIVQCLFAIVQKAVFNGKPHGSFLLDAREVLKGGTLELWMGSEPNRQWGICSSVNSQKVAR